jgi:hypothetical protein
METNATISEIVQKVKQAYQTSSSVKVILDYYATITTAESESKVQTTLLNLAQSGRYTNNGVIVQAFKKLEECGCGHFIVGRKGLLSRFRWAFHSNALAKAVKGEGNESDITVVNEEASTISIPMIKHLYRIRPDLEIAVFLPMDITKTEALRLSEWMKTLYFSEEE